MRGAAHIKKSGIRPLFGNFHHRAAHPRGPKRNIESCRPLSTSGCKGIRASINGDANVQNITQSAKNKLKKFFNGDLNFWDGHTWGKVSEWFRYVLGLRYEGQCSYNYYETPKGIMDFRVGNHNANPANFGKKGADVNISVYVAFFELDFPDADVEYTEYRYSKEDYDAHADEIINAIVLGFSHALETGEFEDVTGYAEVIRHGTAAAIGAISDMPKADGKNTVVYPDGGTEDIISAIKMAFDKYAPEYAGYAQRFRAGTVRDTCRRVYDYLIANVRYKEDGSFYQWVKVPARLHRDGTGDCKSFSLFTACVLANLGIDFVFRFVAYNNAKETTHVYIVAFDENGEELPVDCVAKIQKGTPFGHEYPYTGKDDRTVEYKIGNMTKISILSGINDFFIEQINEGDAQNVKRLKSAINAANAANITGEGGGELAFLRVALKILQSAEQNELRRFGYPLAVAVADGSIYQDGAAERIMTAPAEEYVTVSDHAGIRETIEWWDGIVADNAIVPAKTTDDINDFFMRASAALYPYFHHDTDTKTFQQAKAYMGGLAEAFGVPFEVIANETLCGLAYIENAGGAVGVIAPLDPEPDITREYKDKNGTAVGWEYADGSFSGKKTGTWDNYNVDGTITTGSRMSAFSNVMSSISSGLDMITSLFSKVGTSVKQVFTGSSSSANAAEYANQVSLAAKEMNAKTDEMNSQTSTLMIVGGLAIVGLIAAVLFTTKSRKRR